MTAMWNWKVVQAGALRLDGGSMFGVVPRGLWSKLSAPDERNRIGLQTNCLVLERGGRTVLVETGCGDKWSDKERSIFAIEQRTIVDAIGEVDVASDEIDDVLVTHLHFDHAGGLTQLGKDNQLNRTFENATVHVQGVEWDDALAGKSTMTGTYLRSHLDPIAEHVNLLSGEQCVMPGIRVWPVPGHTWGQQAVLIDTPDGVVCFPGDVMPTRHHVGPPYSMGYDMLPYQNMLTKRSVLERAVDESWTVVLDHEPDTPVVQVHAVGDWFELDVLDR
jgi:glyoxylase-like metal-dependent hydrolase (beta-lactamase superfamily II)